MTRVVLDTNILVSAGISAGGDCDRIVRAVLRKDLQALVSPGILGEYLEILNRSKFTKYGFPPVWVQRFIEVASHLVWNPQHPISPSLGAFLDFCGTAMGKAAERADGLPTP